ncbi:hypothetical protein HPB51_016115 [Rhipicephalus microplus]|uniref:SLC26A/SulP transporter domain-containing protein n=1 Tax=Rhipicephalus microplus TaxID=6941 RepID=A0A9J6DVZ9_RHIMP|nr:hypothetical protein HPB51_016115 [Rhipicephalus microplus]
MMTGTIVRELTSGDVSHDGLNPHNSTQPVPYTVAEVTSTLCLTIGIIQLVFSFLSLGALNVFLSEQMINGFATGVAIQVVVSQLGSLFGNRVPHMSGMFTIYKVRPRKLSRTSMAQGGPPLQCEAMAPHETSCPSGAGFELFCFDALRSGYSARLSAQYPTTQHSRFVVAPVYAGPVALRRSDTCRSWHRGKPAVSSSSP